MSHSNPFVAVADVAAALTVVGAILQYVPAVAALFAILWYSILIWESDTVRGWTGRGKRLHPKTENELDDIGI